MTAFDDYPRLATLAFYDKWPDAQAVLEEVDRLRLLAATNHAHSDSNHAHRLPCPFVSPNGTCRASGDCCRAEADDR